MPISIKRDVKRAFRYGDRFSLRQPGMSNIGLIVFTGGWYVDSVRDRIADQNWYDFYNSWYLGPDVNRDATKAMARKFNLKDDRNDAFDYLWHFIREARAYEGKQEEDLDDDVSAAYRHAATIANGGSVNKPTFERRATPIRLSEGPVVIFSDHHMTAFQEFHNYFAEFNQTLYLDVLNYYAARDYCLVENGDVEECVLFEPTEADAKERKQEAPKAFGIDEIAFPVRLSDSSWDAYLKRRYDQRRKNLDAIIRDFQPYYELLRSSFIPKGKFVRLTGNHDTYLDQTHERTLRDRIETELNRDVDDERRRVSVHDNVRILEGERTAYLVMHGHQFDPACMQHGSIPYAKSLGENYTECLSWAFQGPDRVWEENDTRKWFIGNRYQNILARQEPGTYRDDSGGKGSLLFSSLDRIKVEPKDFVETIMGHEIAWEYFENTNGFHALTLEVWTGDEMYKMKHMDEVQLCLNYTEEFLKLQPKGELVQIPKLILGHTHEPRKDAIFPVDPVDDEPWERADNGSGIFYLNSGSAGRYRNLIWCIEIDDDGDRICSWSRVGDKLKKITWSPDGGALVHSSIDWIDG